MVQNSPHKHTDLFAHVFIVAVPKLLPNSPVPLLDLNLASVVHDIRHTTSPCVPQSSTVMAIVLHIWMETKSGIKVYTSLVDAKIHARFFSKFVNPEMLGPVVILIVAVDEYIALKSIQIQEWWRQMARSNAIQTLLYFDYERATSYQRI